MLAWVTFSLQLHTYVINKKWKWLWSLQLSVCSPNRIFFSEFMAPHLVCVHLFWSIWQCVKRAEGELEIKAETAVRIRQALYIKMEEYQLGTGECHGGTLHPWPRRSFSWQWRRNPNPCALPTLNPPSDCWLADSPLGDLQAVAFQTSTVASAAVVKVPLASHTHPHTHPQTHTHTLWRSSVTTISSNPLLWVLLLPLVALHHEFGQWWANGGTPAVLLDCLLVFRVFIWRCSKCLWKMPFERVKALLASCNSWASRDSFPSLIRMM